MITLRNAFFVVSLFTFLFANAQEEKKENPFSFQWDNGFKLENEDKSLKFKFGGRIMADHAFFSQNNDLTTAFGELETKNGTEIRRARLFFSGTLNKNVEFKLDFGFEGGVVAFKDMYIGLKKVPVIGNIRVGNVKEPFRLEMLTSSKYITFMERSLLSDFAPTRNNGILIFNEFANKKVGFQAGLFRNADDKTANDKKANDGYVFTGRITGLPINNKDNKQLLHLGVGYSYRKPDTKEYKVSSRPEAHLSSQKYISTGAIDNVDHINLLNLEAAFVTGSLSFQGEYLAAKVNAIENYNFSSYYGQVSYFFTGESKKYKSSYAGFDRIKPQQNFGNGGAGAWEVALRYSNSDLTNAAILGGEQSDITLGVNWYLNPSTRIVFNNVFADIKDKGKATIFQVRFQIDF
ncbi:MAG: porin [Flavobacteriaceae bacterium]